MELKDVKLASVVPLEPVSDDHKALLEWACRCDHDDVATCILERVSDPDDLLLQAVKGTLNVLYLMGKKTNLNIVTALYSKYPNLLQYINKQTPANNVYSSSPLSIACRFQNKKFLKWVFKCFNKTLTVIDLCNTGLIGELPVQLFEFTNLKELNVSKNKFTIIGSGNDTMTTFACTELRTASFSDNKFTTFPEELLFLPKLTELNFANNSLELLKLDGIEFFNTPIVNLNFSGNALKTVPPQLFGLPNLTELNLSNNQIVSLPVEMWFAPCLSMLSVNNNNLAELPIPIRKGGDYDLEGCNRSSLYVKSQDSQSFNQSLSKSMMMGSSETIEFAEVSVSDILSPGLKLTHLELNNNKLQFVPPNLACLAPSLTMLSVAGNQLNITPCIRNFPHLLLKLHLSSNRLTKFLTKTFTPNETCPSENCPRNWFYGSRQACTHLSHKKLTKLQDLDMSHNEIDDNINTAYDGTSYYEMLITLNLSNNRFKTFPDFILHQTSLWALDISNNPGITTIPYELSRLKQLHSFKYDGISAPITRALSAHPTTNEKLKCLRLMMERNQRNTSVKLMVLGMHGKGKTTLLEYLRQSDKLNSASIELPPSLHSKSTKSNAVGITVNVWSYCKHMHNPTSEFPMIDFYTWDFVGEDEYYSTHQLFLHSRTLFLVVWNILDGDDGVYGLLPWLQVIQTKAPKSTVIIVGTHLDHLQKSDHTLIKRYKELILECTTHHQNLFWPKVAGIHFVGLAPQRTFKLARGLNVDVLRDDIYDSALYFRVPLDNLAITLRTEPNTKMMDELIPASYVHILHQLIANVKLYREIEVFPVLKYQHFQAMASLGGLEVIEEEMNAALQFLQSKGFVVHFKQLPKYYFIDPEWLNYIFSLFVSPRHTNGFSTTIQRDDLENSLKKQHIQLQHVKSFIKLLESFSVVIPLEFNTLLLPALLHDHPSTLMVGSFPHTPTLAIMPAPSTSLAVTRLIQKSGTGVVMRRLYILHKVPSGFWSQLISHFYTNKVFFEVINQSISHCGEIEDYAPRWNYSKHSIWLTVRNTTLLEVGIAGRDYMDMCQSFLNNKLDLAKLHYISDGHWLTLQSQFNCGVLIEVKHVAFSYSSDSDKIITYSPDMFQHTTKLLSLAIQAIDTLLVERYSIELQQIEELVPCPICLGDVPVDGLNFLETTKLQEQVHCCGNHHTIEDLSQEKNVMYYFHINQCLLESDSTIACPRHGYLNLELLAPDLVFKDIPADKTYDPMSFSYSKWLSGGFSDIALDYQSQVAIKTFRPLSLSSSEIDTVSYKALRKEINIIGCVKDHSHITTILGALSNHHGIVLELAPMGNLQSIIENYDRQNNILCATSLLLTIKQISSAVAHLHKHRIIHRNLNPRNILVFSFPDGSHMSTNVPQKWNCDGCLHANNTKVLVKLSGFQCSVQYTFPLLSRVGAPSFMAPEIMSSANGYNEKVDIYSLSIILYEMLTRRQSGFYFYEIMQLIGAGKRPKFITLDPVYPVILYECLYNCWRQDYLKRPSAEKTYSCLMNFKSSLITKYALEPFGSISTIAVVYVNGVQCFWTVATSSVRQHIKVELTVIQQNYPSKLELMNITELLDVKVCVCQLDASVVVGYADQLAIYDASSKMVITPFHQLVCPKCSSDLQCLEIYANNLTTMFAGQSCGNVHLLCLEDHQDPYSWVKYCYGLRGEVLETMKSCWFENHVELWCSTGPGLIEILKFPVDIAECDHQQIQVNIVSLPLPTAGLVVAIECCVANDYLLVFTMAERASVVTCWDGHSKELIKNICLNEIATCVRVVEPNLYIGTMSGDCMSVELQSVTQDQNHINVVPHSPLERYTHRGPVQALIPAYGTMGCQGNLIRLFSSPEDEDHQGNLFRQGVPCSFILSIGHGYTSPWSRGQTAVSEDKKDEEVDENLCVLVHLV